MNIIDKVYVVGRGNIVVVDDVKKQPIHVHDKVKVRDLQFEVVGVEFSQYIKQGGLILRPNNRVEEIKINDKIEKVMKCLLTIDAQEDFLDGGKLGVNGARNIMDNYTVFVNEHGKDYAISIATADFHSPGHCSFKDNGGIWPPHCIQHSVGAAIYEPLLMSLHKNSVFFEVLTKGTDDNHEEYSIFKNEKSAAKLIELVKKFNIEEIDVAGIAYNYCVADTVKDGLRMLPDVKFRVLKNFCPAIPDGTENDFTNFINSTERVCLVEG